MTSARRCGHPPSEQVYQVNHFGTPVSRGVNTDQQKVPLDGRHLGEVADLDHRHDLAQLLSHLFEDAVVTDHDDGHPRQGGVLGPPDNERIDIEPARREHPGHVRQDPRLILNQSGDNVFHSPSPDLAVRSCELVCRFIEPQRALRARSSERFHWIGFTAMASLDSDISAASAYSAVNDPNSCESAQVHFVQAFARGDHWVDVFFGLDVCVQDDRAVVLEHLGDGVGKFASIGNGHSLCAEAFRDFGEVRARMVHG